MAKKTLKKLANDAEAREKFDDFASKHGNPAAQTNPLTDALSFARKEGIEITEDGLDLPFTREWESLVDFYPDAAFAFRQKNLRQLNDEAEARQMVRELEKRQKAEADGEAVNPIWGLSRQEKIDALSSGRSGLHPLDAWEALKNLDEPRAGHFHREFVMAIESEQQRRSGQ